MILLPTTTTEQFRPLSNAERIEAWAAKQPNDGVHCMNIEEMKGSYDWQEAFGFANEIRGAYKCAINGFGIDDVASIIASDEGENDGDPWLMVGTLKDGRFFFLSAWCDYTGWDCQSGGDAQVASNLQDLIRMCLGDGDRDRLNMVIEKTE